jgi:hypothetical protein
VGVDTQGEDRRAVADPLLDGPDRHPGVGEERHMLVAQARDPDFGTG